MLIAHGWRSSLARTGLLLLVFLSGSQIGWSQETAEKTARERLVAAYELTKQPATDETVSEILSVCEAALTEDLSADDRRYARLLASWAYTKRAESHLDPSGAVDDLDESVEVDLNHAVEFDTTNWRARVLRGIVHGMHRHYDEAIADMDAAIRINERSVNAWYNRGELRYQVGDFVLATFDYTKAIGLDPRDTQAYVGRGHSYFQLGKFSEALADYQKVVLLSSGSAESLVLRGDAFSAMSQWEKARDDYQLAVARDSQSAEAHRKLAWLLATCPDQTVSNKTQAETLARRAHELSGGDWQSVQTLATALAGVDKLGEAIELINAWSLAHPESGQESATALRESLESQLK